MLCRVLLESVHAHCCSPVDPVAHFIAGLFQIQSIEESVAVVTHLIGHLESFNLWCHMTVSVEDFDLTRLFTDKLYF